MIGPKIHLKGTTYRDGRGVYHWKDQKFNSVTTVIGAMAKPALMYWSAKMVAEHVAGMAKMVEGGHLSLEEALPLLKDVDGLKNAPWAHRDKRADEGTQVHAVNEMIVAGQTVDPMVFAPEVRPYITHYQAWIEREKPEFLALEAAVFSREHGYAGTMDTIVKLRGRQIVLDYKTSGDSYPDHSLQLAAYRFGEFLGLPDGTEYPMPQTDGAAILLITPEGCRMLEWECGRAEFDHFIRLRQIYLWQKSKPQYRELSPCQ